MANTAPENPIKKKSTVREYAEAIGIALLLALTLRFFVIEAFKIPSGSMIETLAIGDFIFVNKFSYRTEIPYSVLGAEIPGGGTTLKEWSRPERGDVMVFRFPADPKVDYIKRVVGVEGDVIQVKRNELYVNNVKYARQFVRSTSYKDKNCREDRARIYTENDGTNEYTVLLRDGPDPFETFGPVTVKRDHVFVMGDNRDNSSDSRAWGQVPVGNIKGKAMFVWLSLNGCAGALDRVRWSRFGTAVR
ncbi:MAG: signal peptidase I [Deltaproteobacteria bacterium]|nr:signal peptidase I [Deltaproteobacteria bacterium]